MKKGWKQTWKNLLLQHFELYQKDFIEKLLPKNCILDSFEGKYYIGLVQMKMTDVRHRSMEKVVWFDQYNELNVRTYVIYNNKPGVLFLSLDVDSLISILGARILYGLPYRYRSFQLNDTNKNFKTNVFKNSTKVFECNYTVNNDFKIYEKNTFAFWATERYFFVNTYLGMHFKGDISHKPWSLATAYVDNINLNILDSYPIVKRHKDILFCNSLSVTTSNLKRI